VQNHSASFRISLVAAVMAAGTVAGAAAAGSHAKAHAFVAKGSARQVYVTGLAGNAKAELVNKNGHVVATKKADGLGGLLFRKVKPGSGYHVKLLPSGPRSGPITVHTNASKPWDPKVYNQTIPDSGYGYLKTRDGTKLAYRVWAPNELGGVPPVNLGITPPGGPDYAPPYPTLIEYSGYGYADPSGPTNGIAVLANAMGFAVVDVSMRGTGCSGGAFDFFEPLQSLDGYDVIQTVAHQSWVKGHKVGMMGISYGGISQLFTAATNPPALAAISPLSVIDATATTLEPGGVLNTGFAVAWAKERQNEAQPAGRPGTQPYAEKQIKAGDTTCKANQVLHGEAADLQAKIAANTHYRPKIADPLDPITFVHKIHVPVFMACQFEDEQTGGHCTDLAQHFTGTKHKWFTFTNGAHIDSLDPETYNRWYDFLELYVAKQVPAENVGPTHAASPVIYQEAMGLPHSDVVTMPNDPIQSIPTYAAALSAFEKLKSIRVLFDNGTGTSPQGNFTAGNPYPGFEKSFSRFPVPGTTAMRFYFGPKGTLTGSPAGKRGINWYTSDAHALAKTDFGSNTGTGGLWGNASQWQWKWKANPAGNAVSYISAPLKKNTTVVGAGAVHVWVRSSTPDVDLLATISEVSPSGHETFVQNGWMRASERKLATGKHTILAQKSTLLAPIPSVKAADVRPMPKGKFVRVVIPLYYEGHAYRAGTRIRVTIAAPNGTQPIWSFDVTRPTKTARVSIAFSKTMPSSLFLPVIPGVNVPTAQPPCPSLRNEPCRTYTPFVNRTAKH
jgi:predicted acyl esterase